MNRILGIIMSFTLLQVGIVKAQEITMDLGGPTHSGDYNTKPVKAFSKVKWKTNLGVNGSESFILKNNIIYVTGGKGNYGDSNRYGYFFSIDAINGDVIWKDSVNRFVSTPSMKDTILYFGSDDRDCKIRALNSKNGKLVWDLGLEMHSCWPPALYKDKAFFGDHAGNWYVVNSITGEEIFKTRLNTGICNSPSVLDGIVYYCDLSGILHAFNLQTNSDIWTYNSGSKSNNSPAIVKGVAYLINSSGTLYSIDIKNGNLLWTYKTDDDMYRAPAVSDEIATLVTTRGHIYAFDTNTGTVLWDIHKNSGIGYTNTAIAGSVVYVGCADSYLYAFDLKTGQELWKYKAEYPVKTPLVNHGVVYFVSGNYLYAIE